MNYYKFRFTASPDDDIFSQDKIRATIGEFLGLLANDSELYTWGIETMDKFGDLTHKHVHIHFCCDVKIGTLRKRFQRWRESELGVRWSGGRTGNVLYSLTQEEDVLDLKRFFRYPFKQVSERELISTVNQKFPPNFNLYEEVGLAHEEWKRHVDMNRKKRDDLLKPVTRDKIFEYLDEKFKDRQTTKRDILIALMQFYADEERAANKQTIIGYTQTAMWRYGVETFSDTADRWTREF